ncbi:heme ABC transporter permease [Terrarubrum flagellatum]|uniref:heme ABC transporter permease n=1 Tax=Terrirubrum flagellatum TaxID=2895980 RepID=UPI003144EAEF
MFGRLANPAVFAGLVRRLLPVTAALSALLFAIGLYLAFAASPPDYQQGETVRIMYVHVPAAWLSMAIYMLIAASALGVLVWKHPLADVAARTAAPLGAWFTLLCLVTGSIWGRPMWGAWWAWDGRLTSVFVLFLIYLGLIALQRTIEEPTQAARAGAIMALVGVVNIPIIKFSVDWWSSLHQPASVIRLGGSAIDPSMLRPLFVMAAAFLLLFVSLLLAGMRTEIMRRRARTMMLLAAQEPQPA